VRFVFDESIEGAIRIDNLLAELQADRERRDALDTPASPDPAVAPDQDEGTAEA
jgi:hypothetical protein